MICVVRVPDSDQSSSLCVSNSDLLNVGRVRHY